jgi:hypothetical protein
LSVEDNSTFKAGLRVSFFYIVFAANASATL